MKKNRTNPEIPLWKKNRSLHFACGLILSLTLVVTAFEWEFPDALTDKPIDDINPTIIDQPLMDPVVLPTPPRPKVPVAVVPVPDDTPLSTEEKEDEPLIELDPIDTGEPADLDDLLGNDVPVDPVDEFTDYEIIPAEPKGGEKAFYNYLNKHIQYPDHLKGRNMAGTVHVSFEVDENGRISNVKILKGFDTKLEKEIIRVLENAPEWVPAQQGHRKVTTRHRIPFSFRID